MEKKKKKKTEIDFRCQLEQFYFTKLDTKNQEMEKTWMDKIIQYVSGGTGI